MNHAPISDMERDTELVSDLMFDLNDAWKLTLDTEMTPRSLARIEETLARLHACADLLRDLRVGMDRYVRSAKAVQ